MHWLKHSLVVALAVVVCLGMTACAQELADGSVQVSQVTPEPSPQPTASPTPAPRREPTIPCGPASGEEGDWFSPFSDLFLEWTPDGSQLMFSYTTDIWFVDIAGTDLRLLVDADPDSDYRFLYGFHADISPDGTQVVFSTCAYPWDAQSSAARRGNALLSQPGFSPDKYDIALIDIDGGAPQRLTKSRYLDHFPAWSPDGSRIAYIHFLDDWVWGKNHRTIRTMAADGSDIQEIEGTRELEIAVARVAWSPDGEKLSFLVYDWENWPRQFTLYTALADGSELRKVAENVVSDAAWSPDGQQFALARLVGEEVDLYTVAADGSDLKLLNNITDLEKYVFWARDDRTWTGSVAWSPDGAKLVYSCHKGACLIDVKTGLSIELIPGIPEWLHSHVAAWSPDGTRIAIYTPGDEFYSLPLRLFVVDPDGSNLRDLVRADTDGKLAPANPAQDGS